MSRTASIFLALFTAFSLSAFVRADEPTLDKDPTQKENISIRLPAGWIPDEKPPHAILVARVPKRDQDETSDFQAVLAIASGPGTTVDAQAQLARIEREIPSYKVVEPPARVMIGKLEAATFGGTFTQGPLKLRARQYMLARDNHIYVLTFISLESHWLDYIGQVEASVDTLTIAPAKK